jgi:uncharacterized protein (DUF1810 family)
MTVGPPVHEEEEAGMNLSSDPRSAGDPYDLDRFVRAQKESYGRALAEIRGGRKRSHWMWYFFPQIEGLGFSSTARFYAIKSLTEAKVYLAHPVLGPRLLACAEAALGVEGRSAHEIFGSPDDLKLRSCATLFAQVSAPDSVFDRLLAKYYRGERDAKTLQLLGVAPTAE